MERGFVDGFGIWRREMDFHKQREWNEMKQQEENAKSEVNHYLVDLKNFEK